MHASMVLLDGSQSIKAGSFGYPCPLLNYHLFCFVFNGCQERKVNSVSLMGGERIHVSLSSDIWYSNKMAFFLL